jgi:uncharacterized protein YndB with AHSA1/START domain
MKSSLLMDFSVDKVSMKIKVKKEFAAPVSKVWPAWTESHLLDQWWAPKPWKARTKTMDFREDGHWLYEMVSPKGKEHWARVDFRSISTMKSYTAHDAFCDETGKVNHSMPRSFWMIEFTSKDSGSTIVSVEITYEELDDLEKIFEMGFKEGFTAALENLDELLEKKS